MAITTTEFCRRLCVRNHPHLRTTGAIVPCGEHIRDGHMYWKLATVPGTHTFEVIRDARDEFLDEGQRHVDDQQAALTILPSDLLGLLQYADVPKDKAQWIVERAMLGRAPV